MVPSSSPKGPSSPSKGARTIGRPTKEEAERLSLDVKEAALKLFLERGYEGASLDAIATAAGTTKPSLYIRFDNKETLFTEVVGWAIGRTDWPEGDAAAPMPAPDLSDLDGALRAIAESACRRATHPSMVQLTRVVVAEATRFPELAQETLSSGSSGRPILVDLLQRHAAAGTIVADEPEMLAEQFLGLVAATPAYAASFGIVRDAAAQARYTDVAIALFRRGLQPR